MHIHHGSRSPTTEPPEPGFVGEVGISGYFEQPAPSRLRGATVSFGPGARTPWKTNPLGQMLIVTSGTGWARTEDTTINEIRAGDVIWFTPGEQHWEGATPTSTLTYVAIHEAHDGTAVELGRPVTDEEYRQHQ